MSNMTSNIALALTLTLGASAHAQDHNRQHDNFYGGVREGGRGQSYDRGHNHQGNRRYDDRRPQQGGVGPGKGALIGAGGGVVLGALFGGTKGALVGGAAGAGIGAVVGQQHQQDQRNRYNGR